MAKSALPFLFISFWPLAARLTQHLPGDVNKVCKDPGLKASGGMLGLDPTHTITLIHTVEVHAKCQPPGAKTMTIEGWGTFFVD